VLIFGEFTPARVRDKLNAGALALPS